MPARPMLVGCACLLFITGCDRSADRARRAEEAEFEKTRRPQDPLFIDFQKNWRERISKVPEIAMPVVRPDVPAREVWEPIVISQCVFSADVGALVPQTTLTWNDPVGQQPPTLAARIGQQPPVEQQPQPGRQRVDLAVHHEGFTRNYYSTALSTTPRERFSLPSTSALIADTAAVTQVGPALFPRLMEFRAEMIQDRDSGRALNRQNMVLRDLGEGVTYEIRLAVPGREAWNETRTYTFLTPGCPKGS